MPGMVMFRRRWSVGSDDLVLPALFLFLIHCIWWVTISSRFLIFFFIIKILCIDIFCINLLSSFFVSGWLFFLWFSSAFRMAQNNHALWHWWIMAEGTWASWSAALYVRALSCGWAWGAAFCTPSPEKLCNMSSIYD